MFRLLFGAICAAAMLLTSWLGMLQAQPAAPVPDSRYIPDKAYIGVVARPNAILQNPELQKIFKIAQAMPANPERDLGTEFTNLDVAVFSLAVSESPPPPGAMGKPVIFLRTKDAAAMKGITAKAIRSNLRKMTLPGTTTEAFVSPRPRVEMPAGTMKKEMTKEASEKMPAKEAEVVIDPDAWKISEMFVLPDDRTLLFSERGANVVTVLGQLKPGTVAPAWAKQFDSAARFPLAAFVDVKQAREMIKAQLGGRPLPGPVAMVAPLWEKTDLAVVALDTGDGLKLTVVATSPDADSAKALKGSLDGLLVMGKGFLPAVKGQAAQLDAIKPGLGAQLYGDLEKAVSDLTITQNGSMTVIKFAIQQQTLATITTTIVSVLERTKETTQLNAGMNNLKFLANAMLMHELSFKSYPAAARLRKESMHPHSWRVAILPFIEEGGLHQQYKFDEPWDSEANKKVLAQMPAIFRSPNADPTSTNTSYVVPTFDQGLFTAEPAPFGNPMKSVRDGTSKTLMIIETETSIPWTKPEDLVIDPTKPLPALGFAKSPTLNVAFADGATYRFIKNPTMETLLPFLTRGAGDVGDMEKLLVPTPGDQAPRPAPPPTRVEETKLPAAERIAP